MQTWTCFAIAFLPVLAAAADAPPARVEKGNLVIEGIPEIPAALAERTNQYQQTRSASLLGWLPGGRGILVATRFGETAQVHHVAAPGSDRRQLTFFREPVTAATPNPARDARGFVFGKDTGGDEFYQLHWFDLAAGTSRLLTDGKSKNENALWSTKGDRFAFSTTLRNGKDTDIHVGALDAPGSKPVVEAEGTWAPLDWSPDDRSLLVMKYISITQSELYV